MIKYFTKIALLILSTLFINGLFAENDTEAPENDSESNWDLAIAIGYGQRSNPILLADDINLAVDLNIAWYGKRWFFDNGDIGLTLADGQHSTLNTVARLNSDRVFFQKSDTNYFSVAALDVADITTIDPQDLTALAVDTIAPGQEDLFVAFELPKRDYAFELGVELLSEYSWGNIHTDAYVDISDTHKGMQISLQYSYEFQADRWYFQPSLGFTWKNNNLNDYYWGVRENEASLAIPVYHAGSGINRNARMLLAYQINKKWAWVHALDYEKLNSTISESPIVAEDHVFAWYSGFRYKF